MFEDKSVMEGDIEFKADKQEDDSGFIEALSARVHSLDIEAQRIQHRVLHI
jgi:hypothetical protein